MCLNVEHNFGISSLSGDAIVLCRVLRWGIEYNYAGAPYGVVVGADVVALLYDPVVLARTFHKLIGPWTKVYLSGKAQLAWPHIAFGGEMARLFARALPAQKPGHFHHCCQLQKVKQGGSQVEGEWGGRVG
jgi:hypothetical protein